MNRSVSGVGVGPLQGEAGNPEKPARPDALGGMAALLAEQLSACHAAASRCFAIATDEEDFDIAARLEALKLATKLVQASAAAASAVRRLKGGQFHHHVTVHRVDYAAEKAARKAREKAKQYPEDPHKALEERIDKLLAANFKTPPFPGEQDGDAGATGKRHGSSSRNAADPAGEAA